MSTPFDNEPRDLVDERLAILGDLAWLALRRVRVNVALREILERVAAEGLELAALEGNMRAVLRIPSVPREELVRTRRSILHYAGESAERRSARHVEIEARDREAVRVALGEAVGAIVALVMAGAQLALGSRPRFARASASSPMPRRRSQRE